MSLYERFLPEVFPFMVEVNRRDLATLVNLLTLPNREDVPLGSSFAVVAGMFGVQTPGNQTLWMSAVSFRYLKNRVSFQRGLAHLIPLFGKQHEELRQRLQEGGF